MANDRQQRHSRRRTRTRKIGSRAKPATNMNYFMCINVLRLASSNENESRLGDDDELIKDVAQTAPKLQPQL